MLATPPLSGHQHFQTYVSLKPPIEINFHMEPTWAGRRKVHSNDLGHITKIATTPVYGKTLQIPSFPGSVGQLTKCIETWYVALTTQAHHSFIKYAPGLSLTYVTPNLNILASYATQASDLGRPWPLVGFDNISAYIAT